MLREVPFARHVHSPYAGGTTDGLTARLLSATREKKLQRSTGTGSSAAAHGARAAADAGLLGFPGMARAPRRCAGPAEKNTRYPLGVKQPKRRLNETRPGLPTF
jgi:hypothetical protein